MLLLEITYIVSAAGARWGKKQKLGSSAFVLEESQLYFCSSNEQCTTGNGQRYSILGSNNYDYDYVKTFARRCSSKNVSLSCPGITCPLVVRSSCLSRCVLRNQAG